MRRQRATSRAGSDGPNKAPPRSLCVFLLNSALWTLPEALGNFLAGDMSMEKRPRMLEGYRVLDFTHYVAGPTCTRILGEMGADVIKVERSLEGDHVRVLGVVRDGISSYYVQHNHSKRSLAVDLRKPRGKELLLSMIPKIDVVVENFAPGVIGEMGFGYGALK